MRLILFGGVFEGFAGQFDGSGEQLDYGLLVSSCGLLGLVVVSLVRSRFFHYEPSAREAGLPGLLNAYTRNRKKVLAGFFLLFMAVAAINIYFGIYQRGQVTSTILPYGLNGIFKWLLQFGLASFGALILQFEYVNRKSNSYLAGILILLEGVASNVSLLSRGMILNATAVFYGLFKSAKFSRVSIKFRFFIIMALLGGMLFGISVISVNFFRFNTIEKAFSSSAHTKAAMHVVVDTTRSIFVDRFVGLEGVLSVASSKTTGWDLWHKAWAEVYSEHSTSFYDLNLTNSPYLATDTSVHHYISLPGIVAFCFYPGSMVFLFLCMLLVGLIGAGVEISVYKLAGKNLVLCSLLAQVVAYRFLSFGYVPAQSYLLFGALILNIGIIWSADRWFGKNS